jgi:hypothetical protein
MIEELGRLFPKKVLFIQLAFDAIPIAVFAKKTPA